MYSAISNLTTKVSKLSEVKRTFYQLVAEKSFHFFFFKGVAYIVL
jgi:hypothetical protein